MTAVQQILYADDTAAWHRLAEALGLIAPYPPTSEWSEFHGRGSLGVHRASENFPPGRVDLHLLVEDLDATERILAGFETSREAMEGVGEILFVSCGITVGISEGAVAAHDAAPSVQPIWFAPDVDEARRVLETIGLRAIIASDRGGWIEFASAAGRVGLHYADEPAVGLSFVSEDIDALAARLRKAGYAAAVVDEAFGRTVRLADPDGGTEIWINESQRDLHGYHQVE
ncbi:MAG: VOC family protein [Microbacterium gubbeenense]|uniref:VOC family protein n=1 Tax=Microbacterium gubbeenense TaxID=159896 RepID=UPI003F979234